MNCWGFALNMNNIASISEDVAGISGDIASISEDIVGSTEDITIICYLKAKASGNIS